MTSTVSMMDRFECDRRVAPDSTLDVLLIDDQRLMERVVRDMLVSEPDIRFHYCDDSREGAAQAAAIAPTVILLDLSMPYLDGLTLLQQLRFDQTTREIPVVILSSREKADVKAAAFEFGASDFLVKLPHAVELIARIRHHARGYLAQLKLAQSEARLASEIEEAARHVRSLLPAPLSHGPVRIDWRFVPSTHLAGDAFGYRWLDDNHLAIYLLDVTGHGVGASLLAVSVLNTLTHGIIPTADFRDPSTVLRELNRIFDMHCHGQRYFTIWYGVFGLADRVLSFSGGGHPPALLLGARNQSFPELTGLLTLGPPVGVTDEPRFENQTIQIPEDGRLLLYSDGVIEAHAPDGKANDEVSFEEFVAHARLRNDLLDQILNRARRLRGQHALDDDCSLLLIDFLPFSQERKE